VVEPHREVIQRGQLGRRGSAGPGAPDVWLATCAEWPAGGDEIVLVDLFASRGVTAAWACWDDPAIDWLAADLVAIRTTWDYTERLDDYLAWTEQVAAGTQLVNPPDVVRWNTHKGYLVELAEQGLPLVPTTVAADRGQLLEALASYGVAVVKPAVAVAGNGLVVWRPGDEVPEVTQTMVVQPLVDSVRSRGEVSVYVMGGAAVAQVAKRPASGEVRVHVHRGGAYTLEPLEPGTATLAERAVATVSERFDTSLVYARVDLLAMGDQYVVSEVEVTEPSLYVAVEPRIATAFVDAVMARL
jgi:glutathione synthase/RimK-type ligase-like ATP-grasp enzyme